MASNNTSSAPSMPTHSLPKRSPSRLPVFFNQEDLPLAGLSAQKDKKCDALKGVRRQATRSYLLDSLHIHEGSERGEEPADFELAGHASTVTGLAFLPEHNLIASCSQDQTLRLWPAPASHVKLVVENNANMHLVASSQSTTGAANISSWLSKDDASCRKSASVTCLARFELPHMATCLAVSPNNNIVAVGSSQAEVFLFIHDGRQAQQGQAGQASTEASACHESSSPKAVTSSDAANGNGVATQTPAAAVEPSAARSTGTWQQFGRSFKGKFGVTTALSFSASGTLLASAASDATVRVWHLATGDLVAVLERHRDVVTSLAFNPGSESVMVTTSLDGTVRAWDIGLQAAVSTPSSARASPLMPSTAACEAASQPPSPVGIAAPGAPVARVSPAIKLRRCLRSVTKSLHKWGGGFGRVNNAAFSPSGQCLAVACTNGVWLWGDGVQEVSGTEGMWLHGKDVTAVAFSPTGHLLAASMWDRAGRAAVVLVDTSTWAVRSILESEPGQDHTIFPTTPICFSKDGCHLACSLVTSVPKVHDVEALPSVQPQRLDENVSLAGYGLEVDCAVRALLDSVLPPSGMDSRAGQLADMYNDELKEGELMDLMMHALSTEDNP